MFWSKGRRHGERGGLGGWLVSVLVVVVVVVVVVRTMCYDDVSVDTVTRACTEFGWQNAWEQAPGVPATPEPSMTKNSSSSRAHLALNVRMDGARKRPVKRAKNPIPHRHRHKVRNPRNSMNCSCGISTVSHDRHNRDIDHLSEVLQLWNLCGLKDHSFLHCLDHRHLSLTTAGMSTTWS